jgi:preprotein translocase subunit SecG
MLNMNIQPNHLSKEEPFKAWMKRMTWILPLFFLIKGLAWLAIPLILAIFSLN